MPDLPRVIDLADFRKDEQGPQPSESLMFLKAYMQIKEPRQRAAVSALVEKILAEQDQ